jgi:hypothetical protein
VVDVQFRRTVAKNGRVRVDDQVWDDKKFKEQYTKMNKLAGDLDKLIARIKPVPVRNIKWMRIAPTAVQSGGMRSTDDWSL